jgi:hypothetical protein
MDSWQLDDLPIGKFQVIAEPNPLTGEIKLITEIAGKIQEEFLQTRDEQIHNALIDLGWTPPEGKEEVRESKIPEFRAEYADLVIETQINGHCINELPLMDLKCLAAAYVRQYLQEYAR